MSLFLDSVDLAEARAAVGLGFVAGVTTNPALIAKAGLPAEQIVAALCQVGPGVIFHQLTAETLPALEAEAERFLTLAPGRVGLKIPCTLDGIHLAHRLASRAVCAVTAVYTPAQAYMCSEAGARYVIPYVNRASRQGMDGVALVRTLAAAVAASGRGGEVLAASVKSPEEAATVLGAGARHVTLPWAVLAAMADHPLTALALAEFAAAAREL